MSLSRWLPAVALFAMAQFFIVPTARALVNCGDTCTSDADCPSDCVHCDVGYTGACMDCCVFGDQTSCTTNFSCTWDSGTSECRNYAGVECVAAVPEVPEWSRPWMFSGFGLLIVLLFARRSARKYSRE